MTRRLRTLTAGLAAAALTAALTGLAHSPAGAATLGKADPRGDVHRVNGDDTTAPAARVVNVDLTRVTVAHSSTAVTFTGRYADLRANDDIITFFAEIRTNESVRRMVALTAAPEFRKGQASLFRPDGNGASCPGLRHTIDYATNVVRVSIPRSCLSQPRWVQHRTTASAFVGGSLARIFIDPAGTAAAEPTWSARILAG